MIPARLNSKRIHEKNLRLLCDKPLISYCVIAAKDADCFDEIYINSESKKLKNIARTYGVRFYKRDSSLSLDTTVNDEFVYDFMLNMEGDLLIQLLPTSPLITPQEIKEFTDILKEGLYDTVISVREHKIACVFQGNPINFVREQTHIPSQLMTPVQSYATVLMGWKYKTFIQNMERYGCAYHGSNVRTSYYPLNGFSTIDIDIEEDFRLAEVAMKSGFKVKV
jgi:CMP-N,N'-diacetyllegionaminic acid synthase